MGAAECDDRRGGGHGDGVRAPEEPGVPVGQGDRERVQGQKCEAQAEAAAKAEAERYDPSGSGAEPAFLKEWKKMDLQYIKGFPTWEEEVFNVLSDAFKDLQALFEYYAGDSPGMQQAELVDICPFKPSILSQINENWIFNMKGGTWGGSIPN